VAHGGGDSGSTQLFLTLPHRPTRHSFLGRLLPETHCVVFTLTSAAHHSTHDLSLPEWLCVRLHAREVREEQARTLTEYYVPTDQRAPLAPAAFAIRAANGGRARATEMSMLRLH
jgi:hypothetical protein